MKAKQRRLKMPPDGAVNDIDYSRPFEYEDDWLCVAEQFPQPIFDRINMICRFFKVKESFTNQ